MASHVYELKSGTRGFSVRSLEFITRRFERDLWTVLYVWLDNLPQVPPLNPFISEHVFHNSQTFAGFCLLVFYKYAPFNHFHQIRGTYIVHNSRGILTMMATDFRDSPSCSIHNLQHDPWSMSTSCRPIFVQHTRLPISLLKPSSSSPMIVSYTVVPSDFSHVVRFEL